jgi:8-oxo-dGTP diphosphatase
MIIFGRKIDNVDYVFRPGAYALIFDKEKNKIAVIQTGDEHYFLPGGGLDSEETHEECLLREGIEEMGMSIKPIKYIGSAQRYFYSMNDKTYYLGEGHFYLCEILAHVGDPSEENHILKWVELKSAADLLWHDHQRWAVGLLI